MLNKKKGPKIKPSEIFKRPKILRYSKATLVGRNKPDVTRKSLEMTGIVKAVTKKLEPEDPFNCSCRRRQTLKNCLKYLHVSCLTESALFSYRYVC